MYTLVFCTLLLLCVCVCVCACAYGIVYRVRDGGGSEGNGLTVK